MIYGKYIVALCIPRIHDDTNNLFITKLNQSLRDRNARLMVFTTPTDLYLNEVEEQGSKAVFDLINYDITDAVVIHDEAIKDSDAIQKIVDRSRAHDIPVITLRGKYDGSTRIGFDYSAGFEQVVRHVLKDHGITDFHMLAGFKGNDFSEERIDVVRKVAQELDIPFGDEDISYGQFWSRPTEEAVEKLFVRRRALPQAIICANDTMAIATINVLKKHNVRIPEDILVTGFDGIKDIKYCVPQITSCLCSNEELAETVSDTIMDLINGKVVPAEKLVVPTLQKSASCGCSCGESINASEELNYVNNALYRFQSEEEHMFRMMSRVLDCNDFCEVAQLLDKYDFYDLVIVLNPECTDSTVNPLLQKPSRPFGDTMKLMYNTNYPMSGNMYDIKTSDLHPDMEEMLCKFDNPLIFFALNYMGVPMGYVCFNYHNYDIQNYYKASQIINTLNAAFGAFRTIQYQHYLTHKIEDMYRCDGLTHLLNRMALKNSFPALLAKCSDSITLVLADLDGLKYINDSYGHDDGDFAICSVADALRNTCPSDALCVRWGGDEMVAVIPSAVSEDIIRSAFREHLDSLNAVSGKEYHISASVGVKTFP
ncbi:MAG: diguanylate cyclase domain-containing protein, partial [Oscillospiraceae bacterium]